MNKASLTAAISNGGKEGGWTFVTWPDSAAFLGTGKATRVLARIDGKEFAVTALPTGDGTHFLPLNKALLKATSKALGDTITVEIEVAQ